MGLKFKVKESKFGVPIGMYKAKFLGTEEQTHDEYGPGVEWRFEVAEGEFKGRITSRTTAPEPTLKNSCGKLIKGLTGGKLVAGQDLDLTPYVDKLYSVMVEENSSGNGTRVGSVMPAGTATGHTIDPDDPGARF